ncbi:Hypothetical predicted protein, partial [Cloeon dipterum]
MDNRNWDPALSRLLVTLEESRDDLPCTEEFAFLSELLQKQELHSLVHIHNKVLASTNTRDGRFNPVVDSSVQAALEALADVLPLIEQPKKSWDSRQNGQELLTLLQTPHIQGLLYAHDCIAQKDYYPVLPEVPIDIDEDEETIKIVQLVKSNEPLGATIKTDEETGKIVIARIMHGGAADRSGLIHVGDEVVEVNNICTEGKSPNDVLQILQNSEGTITFKLVPADAKGNLRESKVRVRAHFDYCATSDPYIPCKEAGLDFEKGDILHIVSQDDAYWWQARKEYDRNMRAGLIPSRALQEKRIVHERSLKGLDVANLGLCSLSVLPGCQSPKSPRCASKPRTKKIMYATAENDDFDREEIATYEEVAKLYPRPGLQRPVVLIGPPGIGRNELKRRLMALDPDKFKTTIPFTTRPIKHGEINGKEYYFVSREKMEEDIAAGKFLEHGEYKGNLYGTSADSVKSIINAGYVCILNPHYQALKMLRTPDIKPFVVYIKPPSFDILKETRHEAYARSTFDEANSRGFTDEEFEEIERSAARIEFLFRAFGASSSKAGNRAPVGACKLGAVETFDLSKIMHHCHWKRVSARRRVARSTTQARPPFRRSHSQTHVFGSITRGPGACYESFEALSPIVRSFKPIAMSPAPNSIGGGWKARSRGSIAGVQVISEPAIKEILYPTHKSPSEMFLPRTTPLKVAPVVPRRVYTRSLTMTTPPEAVSAVVDDASVLPSRPPRRVTFDLSGSTTNGAAGELGNQHGGCGGNGTQQQAGANSVSDIAGVTNWLRSRRHNANKESFRIKIAVNRRFSSVHCSFDNVINNNNNFILTQSNRNQVNGQHKGSGLRRFSSIAAIDAKKLPPTVGPPPTASNGGGCFAATSAAAISLVRVCREGDESGLQELMTGANGLQLQPSDVNCFDSSGR